MLAQAEAENRGPAVGKVTVTSIQEQVLQGLVNAGGPAPTGAVPHLLRPALGGHAWRRAERLGVSVRGLEKKGLVEISRRWGTWGYGQPETVSITDTGRAMAETV